MADRLAELLRQRALLQEHLAWLDREIGAASNQPLPSPVPKTAEKPAAALSHGEVRTSSPTSSTLHLPSDGAVLAAGAGRSQNRVAFGDPPSAPVIPLPGPPEAAAEEILEQYRVPPDTLKTDIRKGCLLYFAAAFAIMIVVVGALYLAFRLGERQPAEGGPAIERRAK